MIRPAQPASTAAPLRGEWRVAVVLIISLLAMEGAMRCWVHASEARVQNDNNNVRSLARVAGEMQAYPGHKVLLIGNSLTRDGVDPEMVREALIRAGRTKPGVFPCHPSGTSACTWDYALQRYFIRPGVLPDEVFIFAGPLHLADTMDDAARLRRFFVAPDDMRRAWTWDLHDNEECIRFLCAQVSELSGMDAMLKLRILDRCVPHFTDMDQMNNRLVWERSRSQRRQQRTNSTYTHLTFLLGSLRDHHIRTHIVFMPVIYSAAPLDPEASKVIASFGADLLDMSKLSDIGPADFSDGFHLNAKGRLIFSKHLAAEITVRLR